MIMAEKKFSQKFIKQLAKHSLFKKYTTKKLEDLQEVRYNFIKLIFK
jgi:hypothetical protein